MRVVCKHIFSGMLLEVTSVFSEVGKTIRFGKLCIKIVKQATGCVAIKGFLFFFLLVLPGFKIRGGDTQVKRTCGRIKKKQRSSVVGESSKVDSGREGILLGRPQQLNVCRLKRVN